MDLEAEEIKALGEGEMIAETSISLITTKKITENHMTIVATIDKTSINVTIPLLRAMTETGLMTIKAQTNTEEIVKKEITIGSITDTMTIEVETEVSKEDKETITTEEITETTEITEEVDLEVEEEITGVEVMVVALEAAEGVEEVEEEAMKISMMNILMLTTSHLSTTSSSLKQQWLTTNSNLAMV